MPTIRDLLAAILRSPQKAPETPQDDGFNADRPWDSAAMQPAPMAPQAAPVSSTPYAYAAPDPFAQAQALEQRQGAAAKLGGPMTPILEVPADLVVALLGKTKGKR